MIICQFRRKTYQQLTVNDNKANDLNTNSVPLLTLSHYNLGVVWWYGSEVRISTLLGTPDDAYNTHIIYSFAPTKRVSAFFNA